MNTSRRGFLKGIVKVAAVVYAAPTIAMQLLDESTRPTRSPLAIDPNLPTRWVQTVVHWDPESVIPDNQFPQDQCSVKHFMNGVPIRFEPSLEKLPPRIYQIHLDDMPAIYVPKEQCKPTKRRYGIVRNITPHPSSPDQESPDA